MRIKGFNPVNEHRNEKGVIVVEQIRGGMIMRNLTLAMVMVFIIVIGCGNEEPQHSRSKSKDITTQKQDRQRARDLSAHSREMSTAPENLTPVPDVSNIQA